MDETNYGAMLDDLNLVDDVDGLLQEMTEAIEGQRRARAMIEAGM